MDDRDEKEKTLLIEIESLRQRIKELEHCEEERKRAEETFLDLFNATEEIALLMDQEGIILIANRKAARLYGLPVEKLPGKLIYNLIPADRVESSKEKVRTVLKTRKTVRFEGVLGEKVFENSLYPVLDDGSEVEKIAIYVRDITERKRLQVILQQTEEKYRNIYENAMEGIFQIDPDGRLISANPSLAHIHGYDSPGELIKNVNDIRSMYVNPDDHTRLIHSLFEQGAVQNYQTKMYRKDRSFGWISVNVRLVRDVKGKALYYEGTMMDITERKGAEEALWNERNRFRTLSENAPFGIIMVNEEGVFEYINPKFKELFGYDLNEVPNGLEWFRKAFPNPKSRKEVISTWIGYLRSTRPGEKVPRTLPVICKDGTQKIIHFIPVRLATGEHIVTLEDITERIRAHEALMRSHQELEQLNRAKSKAVNHISHELRTPLAVIQGNIRLLKRKLKRLTIDTNLQNTMETLERNLARLSGISKVTDEIFRISQELEAGVLVDNLDRLWERIEDLSDIPSDVRPHLDALKAWLSQYLSGSTESFQSINLFPFVLDVLERVKQLSSHRKIRFRVEGKNDLFVFIDPLILQNVVEGLLRNAVENTPDGGKIHLLVEQKHGRTTLHVTDYGVGITEENQAYIFDGLFHTKETELYASKKPYDFRAGGKGLDLLRMKVYGQRFGFDLSMISKRCVYIPTDQDQCPGDISQCPHVENAEECAASGGTTFTVAFPPKPVRQPAHI